MGQRQIGRLQRERLVDGRNGRPAEGRDSLHRSLLGEVPPENLVDLVDLDGGNEQRITALDVGGESIGLRAIGQVLDPAAGIDEDQRRSFFSRRPFALTPRAMPR